MDKQRAIGIEAAAKALLDAMDRQHGSAPFSLNGSTARAELASYFPIVKVEADRADQKAA